MRSRSSEAGFTLVEVMVAMVILGIGLLALEALGITAAKSLVRSEVYGTSARAMSRVMEAAVDSAFEGDLSCGTVRLPAPQAGDSLVRVVSGATGQRTVVVQLRPNQTGGLVRAPAMEIASDVFVPGAGGC